MIGPRRHDRYRGAALLTVLILVMTISVLTLGLLARTDMDLASSRNIGLRMQMDELARSGVEHARALLACPQQVDTTAGYWQGGTGLQIAGGDDYYDVTVVQAATGDTPRCTYTVTSRAYRMADGIEVGQSELTAQVRLDPCIAYWQAGAGAIPLTMGVYGDVYGGGDLSMAGKVYGDLHAAGLITSTGTMTGRLYPGLAEAPVGYPGLTYEHFTGTYTIDSNLYTPQALAAGTHSALVLSTYASNPAGVYYCDGDLTLGGGCQITGTLVVRGNLKLQSPFTTLQIRPVKNFPALVVGGDISHEASVCRLDAVGLVQVGNQIDMKNLSGGNVGVQGALCIGGGGIVNTAGGQVTIRTHPAAAAIEVWPTSEPQAIRWTPAGGSFLRSVKRP